MKTKFYVWECIVHRFTSPVGLMRPKKCKSMDYIDLLLKRTLSDLYLKLYDDREVVQALEDEAPINVSKFAQDSIMFNIF